MTQILGQYCINVRDIDKALEFWEGVCELPLQHRTEIPGVLEAVLQAEQGGHVSNWRNTSRMMPQLTWGLRCGKYMSTHQTVKGFTIAL